MKIRYVLPALLATAIASQAAVTSIDLQLSRRLTNGDTSSSLGTIAITTLNAGNPGPAVQSILYTVTGLTLDSVGTADDEITFNMGLTGTSTSATVLGIGASFGAWGVADGTGTASLVDPDEALGFSFNAATVTLGAGATETATVVFNGFTGFSALNVGSGETFDITGTIANDVTNQSIVQGVLHNFTGSEAGFTIEGNTGAMRYNLVQTGVTVTTVPEPSAVLLGAFGFLALLRRRRS